MGLFFSKKGDLKKNLLMEAHITVLVILMITIFPIYWLVSIDIPREFLIGYQKKLLLIISGIFLICFGLASGVAIRRAGTILNSIEHHIQNQRQLECRLEFENQEIVRQNQNILADLQLAGNIQRKLLPTLYPSYPGLNFSWEMLPSNYVGGDMFNVFPLDDENIGIYIMDVKGHGVCAALKAISVTYLMKPSSKPKSCIGGKNVGNHIFRPSETLLHLNERLKSDSGKNFVTMFYGILNILTLEFRYSIAGHNPPLIFSENDYPRVLNKGGPAIGLIPNPAYSDYYLKLEAGDKILLYTDGIIEAEDFNNNFFGLEKLLNVINLNRIKSIREITTLVKNEVIKHLSGRAVCDDMSVLAFEVTQGSPVHSQKCLQGCEGRLTL